MSKPENTFIRSVHKHLPSPEVPYREKMANPWRGGTPDVWYSGPAADLWIEYKFVPSVPVRRELDARTLLSELQMQWLNGRHKENRSVGVIVGCPAGGIILPGLDWQTPVSAEQFGRMLMSRSDLARWIVSQTAEGSNAIHYQNRACAQRRAQTSVSNRTCSNGGTEPAGKKGHRHKTQTQALRGRATDGHQVRLRHLQGAGETPEGGG